MKTEECFKENECISTLSQKAAPLNGDTHSLKEREDPGDGRDKLTSNCTEHNQNSAFSSACQGDRSLKELVRHNGRHCQLKYF